MCIYIYIYVYIICIYVYIHISVMVPYPWVELVESIEPSTLGSIDDFSQTHPIVSRASHLKRRMETGSLDSHSILLHLNMPMITLWSTLTNNYGKTQCYWKNSLCQWAMFKSYLNYLSHYQRVHAINGNVR